MTIQRVVLQPDGRLTQKQIVEYVTRHDVSGFEKNLKYVKAESPILTRTIPADSGPDHRIVVSYARKIINTVTGYMYKDGLITYATENEKYLDIVKGIFQANREAVKTSQIGRQTSIQGVGYELHYVEGEQTGDAKLPVAAIPRFAKVEAAQMIPLYNYDLEPELSVVIRHYKFPGGQNIDVYYPDRVFEYYLKENLQGEHDLDVRGEHAHSYGRVPVVVFRNNEELQGDFDNVKTLIDAYDVLISDSMNEFDRFAWAYLIMKGFELDEEQAKTLKRTRVFEGLDPEDAINFLTKDVDSEFIAFLAERIRTEIHRQSHVPDFVEEKTGGQLSGIAISKLLYDFEFIAATKELYFKEGLYQRLDLLDAIIGRRDGNIGSREEVNIVMERNIPQNDLENAEVFGKYDGRISRQTLMENFATFVKDARAELAQWKAEQEELGLTVDLDEAGGDDADA